MRDPDTASVVVCLGIGLQFEWGLSYLSPKHPDGYFQAGGRLVAYWANPGSMAQDDGWDDSKSVCFKDLKQEKIDPTKKLPVIGPDDCKVVEIGKK
jgi:hypothetical protein